MRVLIALDTSSASAGILNAVQDRPWTPDTEFHLVSVVEQTTGPFGVAGSSSSECAEVATKMAASCLQDAMVVLRRHLPHATVFAEVLQGGAVGRIVARAEELCADLIVIGHQGCYGLGGQTLGGVAQGIVQRAHCSVAVIKPKISIEQLPDKQSREGLAAL